VSVLAVSAPAGGTAGSAVAGRSTNGLATSGGAGATLCLEGASGDRKSAGNVIRKAMTAATSARPMRVTQPASPDPGRRDDKGVT
jgi:hypothetical protein